MLRFFHHTKSQSFLRRQESESIKQSLQENQRSNSRGNLLEIASSFKVLSMMNVHGSSQRPLLLIKGAI